MQLLIEAFNPATIDGLMCRNTISVGWRGEVYDCDFNQQLGMQWNNGKPMFLWDLEPDSLENREIMTGDHCFGCTAGAGSTCGGAIVYIACTASLCEACAPTAGRRLHCSASVLRCSRPSVNGHVENIGLWLCSPVLDVPRWSGIAGFKPAGRTGL